MKRFVYPLISFFIGCIACTAFAQNVGLDGPTEGKVNQPLQVRVTGLPEIDPDAPLKEVFSWTKNLVLIVSGPEPTTLDQDATIDFLNSSLRVRATLLPKKPGTYVIVLSWSGEKKALLLHRIEIASDIPTPPTPPGPNPPTPPTPSDLTTKLPGTTARLLVVYPANPAKVTREVDLALNSPQLRDWADNNLNITNKVPDYRSWPDVYDDTSFAQDKVDQTWITWYKYANECRRSQTDPTIPWILWSDGKSKRHSSPLPKNLDEITKLLNGLKG